MCLKSVMQTKSCFPREPNCVLNPSVYNLESDCCIIERTHSSLNKKNSRKKNTFRQTWYFPVNQPKLWILEVFSVPVHGSTCVRGVVLEGAERWHDLSPHFTFKKMSQCSPSFDWIYLMQLQMMWQVMKIAQFSNCLMNAILFNWYCVFSKGTPF